MLLSGQYLNIMFFSWKFDKLNIACINVIRNKMQFWKFNSCYMALYISLLFFFYFLLYRL